MSKNETKQEESDRHFHEGERDAEAGNRPDPPHRDDIFGTIFNPSEDDKDNRDYRKGYDAGKKK
jgi:hypothetical protein